MPLTPFHKQNDLSHNVKNAKVERPRSRPIPDFTDKETADREVGDLFRVTQFISCLGPSLNFLYFFGFLPEDPGEMAICKEKYHQNINIKE